MPAAVKFQELGNQHADGDGKSGRPREDQRENINPEGAPPGRCPPDPGDVIADGAGAAGFRGVKGNDEGKRDHAHRRQQDGQRSVGSGRGGDKGQEECDINQGPDGEGLADDFHQAEPPVGKAVRRG